MSSDKPLLRLKRVGIDTYREAVIYMRGDCDVCLSEGFEIPARLQVRSGKQTIIATLNMITSDILQKGEAGLSDHAMALLGAREGDGISVRHAGAVTSLSHVRSKIYGKRLGRMQFDAIVRDITAGYYSDIHLSSFLTACAGGRLNTEEITHLTAAMVSVGDRLTWHSPIIVDKHCVGGLPGNRTTPIVVAIVSAFGLTMPKTSSRAITSPSGTADTMEVLTPVTIDVATMKAIVGRENGCFVWGGAASLSPADDILIRVERALDLDSQSQMVASVLSKKIAAGSTHVVIDIPIGDTAKVRNQERAEQLRTELEQVGRELGLVVKIVFSDGRQPVGRGIGPALEARDIVAVLQNSESAPQDLRQRALTLAGLIIEFSPTVAEGEGLAIATHLLDSGRAWQKFQAICEAQGGMREIPVAPYTRSYPAEQDGRIVAIDNRRLAMLAKLAGAPGDKAAGIDLHTPLGTTVQKGDPLFTIHAESPGQLQYALGYLDDGNHIIRIGEYP